MQRQAEDGGNYERRLESLSAELNAIRRQLSVKDDVINQQQLENDQFKEKCFTLETELSNKIEELDGLAAEHRQINERYDDMYLSKGADGALKIEVDQLQQDNAKLLKLLKQTREYQDFANFVDDSGGNVKSVKSKPASSEQLFDQEAEHWMPNEAYSLAHSFRDTHGNDVTPDLINQLLGDLNKIWREREKKQITRIKQTCQQETNQLKRQLSNRAPFDEVTAKKSISRLQKQLDDSR